MRSIQLFELPHFPLVQPGDDLVEIILRSLAEAGENLLTGDVIVIAQKVVSKAEGRLVPLSAVTPSPEAQALAEQTGKEPRVVQVVLSESKELLRVRPGLLVVEQNDGWICANAGVDRSNVQPDESKSAADPQAGDVLALLPKDADASAARLRTKLSQRLGLAVDDAPAILIIDSHGRAWRRGTVGVCIGCAGLPPIWDQRGLSDLFGYELRGSEECVADELAAAASLLMGQSNEGTPAVVVRGFLKPPNSENGPAKSIQRPKHMDVFR